MTIAMPLLTSAATRGLNTPTVATLPSSGTGASRPASQLETSRSDQLSISSAARSRFDTGDTATSDLAIQSKTRETTDVPARPLKPQGRSTDRQINLQLEAEQLRQLIELRTRDSEVRAHEQAHIQAAGPFISSPATFTFVRGPDGRQFAIAGSVSIDTAPIPGDPEATVRKEAQVERAALAPRDPSAQDRRVAVRAKAARLQAQRQLQALQREQAMTAPENGSTTGSTIDRFA